MHLRVVSKSISEQSAKVPPKKQAYNDRRKYLTAKEVDKLEAASRNYGRYGARNALMIRMAYRHALRACEIVALTWEQVNLPRKELQVNRRKNSKNGLHYINDQEARELRKLKQSNEKDGGTNSDFIFVGERGGHVSERAFFKVVQKAGNLSGLGHVHPHMLRHAAGYELINKDGVDLRTIQDYMGHKNIQNTVIYTELCSRKFKKINQLL
jgi:type 1 fimbriae regulatory protein FimB/type 1 fimbriae regulatory protein FimE